MKFSDIKTVSNDLILGIISRNEFLKVQKNLPKKDLVLILVLEPGMEDISNEIVQDFKDVLQIKFWDVEESFCQYDPLTDSQGNELKEFILKNKDSQFLISCKAGKSRSAGVGLAIECLINHSGDKYAHQTSYSSIKEHKGRYTPNLTVYDKILK